MSERRILQVLGHSAGGVGRHVAEIVRALDGDGGLIVDVGAPADLRVAMPKAIVPVEIPDGVSGHIRAVRRLMRVIDDGRYDLVHAHGLRAGFDGALAARRRGITGIVTLHNLVRADVSGGVRAAILRRAEPFVVRLSSRTFVPSREMAEHLKGSGRGNVEVLYAGTSEPPVPERDAASVRAELGVTSGGGLVVTVARLHPQKALDVMLDALARLDDDVVLAVVGEGPLEGELKRQADRLGVDDRVRWLGFRTDVADYLAAADVFCMSSVWEAVPLAAQEAVLVGTPVVATDVGGVGELITDGVSGRLVAKGDAAGLADALGDVLGSEDLHRSLADKARADYDQRFSREAVLGRLKEVYLGRG